MNEHFVDQDFKEYIMNYLLSKGVINSDFVEKNNIVICNPDIKSGIIIVNTEVKNSSSRYKNNFLIDRLVFISWIRNKKLKELNIKNAR